MVLLVLPIIVREDDHRLHHGPVHLGHLPAFRKGATRCDPLAMAQERRRNSLSVTAGKEFLANSVG